MNMDVDKNFLGSENWQFQVCRRVYFMEGVYRVLLALW